MIPRETTGPGFAATKHPEAKGKQKASHDYVAGFLLS